MYFTNIVDFNIVFFFATGIERLERGCCTVVVRLFRIQKVGGSIPFTFIYALHICTIILSGSISSNQYYFTYYRFKTHGWLGVVHGESFVTLNMFSKQCHPHIQQTPLV